MSDSKEIAKEVVQLMKAEKKVFWVEPEKHYQDHEWIGSLRVMWSGSAKVIGTAVLLAILYGAYKLSSLGMKVMGK